MFELRHHIPLAPYTTLGLGGPARHFTEVTDEAALRDAIAWARTERIPSVILGGGSNVLVDDDGFDGLVIRLALKGRWSVRAGERVHVTAAAGESWDGFVASAVSDGLAGIECLSGIPGSVGATPIQNVGAYGQEVSETIASVRVLDPITLEERVLSPAECAFDYRDSAFKRNEGPAAGAIVLAVTFALTPAGAPAVRYAELSRALGEGPHAGPMALAHVRDTVIALRRAKSMVLDPSDPNGRSVGSFFTNPVVSESSAREVIARAVSQGIAQDDRAVPRWDAPNGRVKLAAGWLIEHAGFAKGLRRGSVGISTKHALSLVHHGGGSTRALLALADEIQQGVREAFGVSLAIEPVRLR